VTMSSSSGNPRAAGTRWLRQRESVQRACDHQLRWRSGGHFQGRPNNDCRPDQLIDATGILGRTARRPMLWIYSKNDSCFGPHLSKQMFQAWQAAAGNTEYHLLPAFKQEGHLLVDYPQAVAVWAPLVQHFLAGHP
jgi:hypothetical protein